MMNPCQSEPCLLFCSQNHESLCLSLFSSFVCYDLKSFLKLFKCFPSLTNYKKEINTTFIHTYTHRHTFSFNYILVSFKVNIALGVIEYKLRAALYYIIIYPEFE